MISLTRKTDYALLALAHLAQRPGQTVSAREISERYRISQPLLTNVMKELCSAALIVSTRGARGGYALSRPADRIRLDAIIAAMEGPLKLAPCVKGGGEDPGGCDHSASCPMQGPLLWLHDRMMNFWAGISLAELAAAQAPDEVAP